MNVEEIRNSSSKIFFIEIMLDASHSSTIENLLFSIKAQPRGNAFEKDSKFIYVLHHSNWKSKTLWKQSRPINSEANWLSTRYYY